MSIFARRPPQARILNPTRVSESRNALTAAGYRIKRQQREELRQQTQTWQRRALAYYDVVPEIKYAAQFYSRMLSQVRLFAAEVDDSGELQETKNEDVRAQLDRIKDPGGGGRAGLQSSYGRLRFLTGEAILFVTKNEETNEEQWEMLSSDELRIMGDETYMRVKGPSIAPETFRSLGDDDYAEVTDEGAVAYRIWNPHPRFSSWADATMQGVLDVCEELVMLTQSIRARTRSRLAGSGILIVNSRFLPLPAASKNDEDVAEDPFLADLTEAMTTPIVDEGTASAVVPLIVRIETEEDLDKVMKHLELFDSMQLYPEYGMRLEAVNRLAIGLDMPPEALKGFGEANHWSGWLVDETSWKAHGEPVAQQLVDQLTSSFFLPTLREEGIENWQKYRIAFDPAAVVDHPDRSKDGKDLYDRRAIGKKALREAANFSDDDAPTEEELFEMIGVEVRDSSLAIYGIPQVRGTGIEPAPGELETGTGTSSADVSKTPPETNPADTGDDTAKKEEQVSASANGHSEQIAKILGASDLALQRAREIAGSRLRNLTKRDKETAKLIDGVANARVPSVLGLERARALGAPTERQLVAGCGELITQAFRLWGIEDSVAEPIADRIEQHAARTLYKEKHQPLPQTFTNYVQGLRLER